MNLPAFLRRNKAINQTGMTDDLNADSVQIELLTDFANALPTAAELAALPVQVSDLESDMVDLENEVMNLTTDEVPEGFNNVYFSQLRVRFTQLTGYLKASAGAALGAGMTLFQALGILEKRIDDLNARALRIPIRDYSGNFSPVPGTLGEMLQNSSATDIQCILYGDSGTVLPGSFFYLRQLGTGVIKLVPTFGGSTNAVPQLDLIDCADTTEQGAVLVLLYVAVNHWQASVAHFDAVPQLATTATVRLTRERIFPFVASGSWDVDPAGRVAGVTVAVTLGAGVAMPPLDPGIFILPPTGGTYTAGKQHLIMFCVSGDLRVIYTITPLA